MKFYFANHPAVEVGNVLTGKKGVFCGDSFTEAIASTYVDSNGNSGIQSDAYDVETQMYKTWPWWIAKRNGMTLVNLAQSGQTMAKTNSIYTHFSDGIYTQIPEDADYIIIRLGINDTYSHEKVTIGTIDDTENTTFYGAWNVVMSHIIQNHPYAKIGIIVSNGMSNSTADEPYAEAIRAVAVKYGVPYLDMDKGEQVPLMHRTNRTEVDESIRNIRLESFRCTESDTHPNPKAHEYESAFIEAWMLTL